MNVLVSSPTFTYMKGSETHALSIIEELIRRNINVEAHSIWNEYGPMQDILKNINVPFHSKIEKNNYDLVITLSGDSKRDIVENGLEGITIQSINGVFQPADIPRVEFKKHVSVSEESLEYCISHDIACKIIRNGVDMNKFNIDNKLNLTPKKILSTCRDLRLNKLLKSIANQMGIEFNVKDSMSSDTTEMEREMNSADIVFGLGRNVIEAMACGRNVICLDNRSYMKNEHAMGDGFLDVSTAKLSMKNNFSGRFFKKEFKREDIIKEIEKYNPYISDDNRQFALEHFNIKDKVDYYLKCI